MHCALQKKRDTTFCTSHCSPACRPYKSAVLMWCLCLSSTSCCALVQELQRWAKRRSGFSALSSLALATSLSKLFLLPWPQVTNSAYVACVLQCNSDGASLLWLLNSAFSHIKSFLPFVNRFLEERQKTQPTNQNKKPKKTPIPQANANTKPMGMVGRMYNSNLRAGLFTRLYRYSDFPPVESLGFRLKFPFSS